MKLKVAAQYNVAAPRSIPARVAHIMRRRMFEMFLLRTRIAANDSVIDVGVTSDQSYDHSNYLEEWYQHKDRITAVGLDDASFLEDKYPGITFRCANGLDLPFSDQSFDFAHSSAVIEHVGNRANQARFLSELFRVCRKGIFVTTPNRWYPVEFHTVLPLIHWLPMDRYRSVLRCIKRDFFAEESNLNLMSSRDLARAASAAGLSRFEVTAVWLGLPSNLVLIARR